MQGEESTRRVVERFDPDHVFLEHKKVDRECDITNTKIIKSC